MLDRILAPIARKMVNFWAKTSFKLHKMSGEHIESDTIQASFSQCDVLENCVEINADVLVRPTKFKLIKRW